MQYATVVFFAPELGLWVTSKKTVQINQERNLSSA